MTDRPCRMTLLSEDRPRAGDVVTRIDWNLRSGTTTAHIERGRRFYARHMIALPWRLFKWAFVIGWRDLKGVVRGEPKRPIETVADALARAESRGS